MPAVKNQAWVKTPIDAFILAKLEEKNLQPNPPADKLTLLRRATIDMTGLPPTQEEIQQFLSDNSPNAWEKVVDRLLASPAYGERWGTPLAGCSALRRQQRLQSRRNASQHLALSRLRDQGLQ